MTIARLRVWRHQTAPDRDAPPYPTLGIDERAPGARTMTAATDVELVRRRFTLDEYDRMAQVGIRNEDDRVALIRGEIVQMTPIGRDHAWCVARLNHLLMGRLHGRVIPWHQNPLAARWLRRASTRGGISPHKAVSRADETR